MGSGENENSQRSKIPTQTCIPVTQAKTSQAHFIVSMRTLHFSDSVRGPSLCMGLASCSVGTINTHKQFTVLSQEEIPLEKPSFSVFHQDSGVLASRAGKTTAVCDLALADSKEQ